MYENFKGLIVDISFSIKFIHLTLKFSQAFLIIN